ncbi:MAG: 3-dehydroquinate synthase [Planctomycetes bacterium]|nr:3-dehydroquinate synthase [Planctomycetota bacterium]
MPEIELKTSGVTSVIRIGRQFSLPDLSMDRIGPDRFVVADSRVKHIAQPWIAGGQALFLPATERTKTLSTVLRVIRALLRSGHERGQPLVAVGGGVISDVAGFAASIYKRGIPLHVVPTTLLAQVDAAIGGKNGVDLPEGKNLLGTIRQPDTVLIDPLILAHLPDVEFRSGLAEVVKYGIVKDPELLDLVERRIDKIRQRDPAVLLEVLTRCVCAKVEIVSQDERDEGGRAVLNYGHTVGHALEAATGYRLRHGEAVAAGMHAAGTIAARLNLASPEFLERQRAALAACGLPTRIEGCSPATVLRALRHDKKRAGGKHRFVLAEGPGKVRTAVEVEEPLVRAALRTILA